MWLKSWSLPAVAALLAIVCPASRSFAQGSADWPSVVDRVREAVVFIEVEYSSPSESKAAFVDQGTGFFISRHGQLLTAGHVVMDRPGFDRTIKVYPTRGGSTYYVGTIVGKLPDLDTAVLQVVPEAVRKYIELGDSQDIRDGQIVLGVGFPSGSWATGLGAVTSTSHGGLWRFAASTGPGNSGGPIIDACGRAVGLILQGGAGTTDAIPSARLLPLALGYLPRKTLLACSHGASQIASSPRGGAAPAASPSGPSDTGQAEQRAELIALLDAAIAQLAHHPRMGIATRAITSGMPLDYRSNGIIRHPEQSKHTRSKLSAGERAVVLEQYQQITSEIISNNSGRDGAAAAFERAKRQLQ